MSATATDVKASRKVEFLLFIGILFVPIVFVWFLLRKGYSGLTRIVGFSWLVCVIFSLANVDEPRKPALPLPAKVEAQSPEIVAASVTLPLPTQPATVRKPDPATIIANNTKELAQIEKRLRENATKLKGYYGTPEQLEQVSKDIVRLVMLQVEYSDEGKSREEKIIGKKAKALLTLVTEQARVIYASSTEEAFVKSGFDIRVVATGKNKTQLRLTYALMSKPLVYKFQNETEIKRHATKFGFAKLIYTNGFESELGQTWTVDLKK